MSDLTPFFGDGTIAQVEFLNGTNSIATVTQAPYTTNWANVTQGSYSLTAKATDNLGATTTSAAVPVAVTANTPKAYDIHADHLNTPRVITDATGTEVWRWDSAPFGETLPNEQPAANASKFVFNYRFPGQYYDVETGLHYNYFRDYDPSTGRYIESDPIGLKGGINTFGYAGADPVNFMDIDGLAKCRYAIGGSLVCISNNPDDNDAGIGLQSGSVFSGNGKCKNNSSEDCIKTPKEGPVPPGCYNVTPNLTRPGFWNLTPIGWSKADAAAYWLQNKGGIGKQRGGFMLHLGTVSLGCITISNADKENYKAIDSLLRTENGSNILCVSK